MSESNASPYVFELIEIDSERLDTPIDIRGLVTDVEMFEHLDKSYMTGKIVLLDSIRLLEGLDLIGGERVTITISGSAETDVPFTNNFHIVQVETYKGKDNIQTVILNLIESHAFESNLKNINRYYTGKASEIATTIADNFLERELAHLDEDKKTQSLIVPNMDPLTAIKWICGNATTTNGYPFYVFSTAFSEKLFMLDLGTMLKSDATNKIPYNLASVNTTATLDPVKRKTAHDFKFGKGKSIFDLISDAVIASNYRFLNTHADTNEITWDVIFDLFDELIGDGVIKADQRNVPFSDKYKINGRSFNQLPSFTISKIGGSYAYRETDDEEYGLGYAEERTAAEYKLHLIKDAMKKLFAAETPLTIVVNGYDFIGTDLPTTIGNTIDVVVPKASPETTEGEDDLDLAKSGNYLIYAARHMFKKGRYDISFLCSKIGRK